MLEIWGKRKAGMIRRVADHFLLCSSYIFHSSFCMSKYYLWLISVFFQKFTYQYENRLLVNNNGREMVSKIFLGKFVLFICIVAQECIHFQAGYLHILSVVLILLCVLFQPLVDKPFEILFEVHHALLLLKSTDHQIKFLFCFLLL